MGCRETFFAPARRKVQYFAHFELAGAIFLSHRHPTGPHGATQGRTLFHTTPRAPPAWQTPKKPQNPTAIPVGGMAWPDNEPTRQTTGYHTQRPGPTGVEGAGGTGCGARGRWRGLTGQRADAPSHTPAHQAPQVRRAPEGPEVQAAVGGGGAWLRCPWAVVGPGRASRRRAERSSRRGRLAGGPPPTGTQSSPGRSNTSIHSFTATCRKVI